MNRFLRAKIISTIIILMGLTVVGCGGGGGGGAASGSNTADSNTGKLFQSDLKWLQSSVQASAKAADSQFNGAVTKAFGGDQPSDVYQFIRERVKHVYSDTEMAEFRVTARWGANSSQQWLIKEMSGEDISNGTVFQSGANDGASLAMFLKINEKNMGLPIDLTVALPTGPLRVDSFRVGLVRLTKYYSVLPDDKGNLLPLPPESRISTLVHEGRHSDCPQGIQSDDCAFSHRICPSGPAKGEAACDNSLWGPYALGAIYLMSTLNNYAPNTKEHHLVKFMMEDSLSRLTKEQFEALETTDPLLGSI
jgi:hypothetical protein